MIVKSLADIEAHLATIEGSTGRVVQALAALASPTEALRQMKFGTVGRHPIEDRALNVIEQVNQTFSYLVALNAARWLLDRHPEAEGFALAPGAHASQRLDIMSVVPDLVGAERSQPRTPTAIESCAKISTASSATPPGIVTHSSTPGFAPGRQPKLERSYPGIEVHCVDI